MAKRPYSALNALVQNLAATRAGAWFLAKSLHHLDRSIFSLTAGRFTLTGILAGAPVVILTTVGAKSGSLRTAPLLPILDPLRPDRFALIATNWGGERHPAWYFNLKINPAALCRMDGRSRAHIAHEAAGEEYDQYWQLAVETYAGFKLYKERAGARRIPIVIMNPL